MGKNRCDVKSKQCERELMFKKTSIHFIQITPFNDWAYMQVGLYADGKTCH